jgi:hypothetical protein
MDQDAFTFLFPNLGLVRFNSPLVLGGFSITCATIFGLNILLEYVESAGKKLSDVVPNTKFANPSRGTNSERAER